MPETPPLTFNRVVLDTPQGRFYVRCAVQGEVFFLRSVADDEGVPYTLVLADDHPTGG